MAGLDPELRPVLALVAAYHRSNPLGEDEIAVLPDLVAARLAMSLAIGAWRARRHPGNRGYILRNRGAALAGLEALAGLGATAADRFAEACAGGEDQP
jgi:hydroxylysine kinase